MNQFFIYLFIATCSLSIFYLAYRLFMRNNNQLEMVRFYLLSSITISLLLPFNSYRIELALPTVVQQEETNTGITGSSLSAANPTVSEPSLRERIFTETELQKIGMYLYLTVISFLLARFIFQLSALLYGYFANPKIQHGKQTLIINKRYTSPFSFFKWVYIDKKPAPGNNMEQVIMHEQVHATQLHSIDLILIELMAIFMWFNPLVWKMKTAVVLTHEFLADRGVLMQGINKTDYQAQLVNQAAGGHIIGLSSKFSKSLIKKRIIMMTTYNAKLHSRRIALIFLPLTALLFLGTSYLNGQTNDQASEVAATSAPEKVIYTGIDNLVRIHRIFDDSREKEVVTTVDNGSIRIVNRIDFIISPTTTGKAIVTRTFEDQQVDRVEFTVSPLPRPIANIAGKTGGEISRELLLKQDEIELTLEPENPYLHFEIIGFTMSMSIADGVLVEERVNSSKITEQLKDLVRKLESGKKIYVEGINCRQPDGKILSIKEPIILKVVD